MRDSHSDDSLFQTEMNRSSMTSCFQGKSHLRFILLALFLVSAYFFGITGSLFSQTIDIEGGTTQTNNNTTTNVSNLYIGSTSASNSYIVQGAAGVTTITNVSIIGGATTIASANLLVITNSGTVNSLAGATIGGADSFSNSALVTGSGTWNMSTSTLTIGAAGASSGNSLIISNGGSLIDGKATVDDNGLVQVTGSNSTWSNSASLRIGLYTSSSTLLISNGGRVTSVGSTIDSAIGYNSESTNNLVLITGSNSVWSNSATLAIGEFGSGNAMIISNGGTVNNGTANIGYSSSNNSVLVTDSNSSWNNSGNLTVGNGVAGNLLTISNGGRVTSSNGAIQSGGFVQVLGTNSVWSNSTSLSIVSSGSSNNGMIISNGGHVISSNGSVDSNGLVQVTGSNSMWSNSASLRIGLYTSSSTLLISNGGMVTSVGSTIDSAIGYNSGSTNNLVLITGSNSVWSNSSTLAIGEFGSGNAMIISNGGTVNNGTANIGYSSSNNSVLVTASNSSWNNSADLTIGVLGNNNSMTISNGGAVTNASGFIGSSTNSSNNIALVTGSNSSWNNTGTDGLNVGISGSSNQMTISAGATVTSLGGFIALNAESSNNSILVTGSNSSWNNGASALYIGYRGNNNSMVISNGGMATNADGNIGFNASSSGNIVLVTGSNSTWNNSGDLSIGNSGFSNTMTISAGARVSNSYGTLGFDSNSSGNSVLVTGSNSAWNNGSNIAVGNYGSSNTMTISAGATVTSVDGTLGFETNSSGNSVLVTGSNSTWNNSGDLVIGNYGSSNTMVISNGGGVNNVGGTIGFESNSSSNTVLVTGSGATWSNSGTLLIGYQGTGSLLTISNGGAVVSETTIVGYDTNSTNNIILITGTGSSLSNSDSITLALSGTATLTLTKGGVLAASNIIMGEDTGSVATLNIGTFGGNDNSDSNPITAGRIRFRSGTNTINFNQTNIVALSMPISSTAGGTNFINQLGSGTTILSGNSTYRGTTTINNGILQANSTKALGNSDIDLTGGNLDLNTNVKTRSLTWATNTSQLGILIPDSSYITLDMVTISDTNSTNYINVGAIDYRQHLYMVDTNQINFDNSKMGVAGMTNAIMTSININGTNYDYYQSRSGGALVVTGTETVSVNLTPSSVSFSPNSTLILNTNGTIMVSGDYTSTNSGTFEYDVASPSTTARLTVGGNAFLAGTLNVNFTQGTSDGDKNALISAASFTGNYLNVGVYVDGVLDPLHRERLFIGEGSTLYGITAPHSYTQVAQNQNQINVAAALDSFIPPAGTMTNTSDESVVSFALDQLTEAQYPNAFNQISPTLYTSLATTAFNNAVAQYNEMVQRLGNIRVAGIGFSSMGFNDSPIMDDSKNPKSPRGNGKDILVPSVDNHWGIFVDGNGIFANVNINNQLPGYSVQSGGVTFGGDYKWNETFSTGIYAGYEGSQSKQSEGTSIIDNGSRFGVFGTYQKEGLFANAIIGGDSHSYQISRGIQFPGIDRTATSAPTAGELDSMFVTGYDMKRGNFTFGPITSLQYTYFGLQPFNESGAQSLDLSVANANANSLLYSLGSHCFYSWQANSNILIVPQINLGWQHEFLQNPYALNSTLSNGANFTYMSTTPTRDSFYTGIGFSVNFAKKYDASFFYNASACNPSLVSQNFFASLGMNF